ncbi:hypothetical protein NKH75_23965 [Mesorhizobium sp. M0984]|uniref:hypothetical protein n=1 Tax=Mesorhizobium sp. M0984 TaxID=2957041 RepID=UPI00333602EB
MLLLIRWLSAVLPTGFRFSALATLIAIIAAPIIGLACGALFAFIDLASLDANRYVASAMVNAFIAMIAAPLFVAYCRHKPSPRWRRS